MTESEKTHTTPEARELDRGEIAPEAMALVIAWSLREPHRVGEVAVLPSGRAVLGRGEPTVGAGEALVRFGRQRPLAWTATGGLVGASLSRRQLVLRSHPDRRMILFEKAGRCPVRVNGVSAERGALEPGDTLLLEGQLVLLCVNRPPVIPASEAGQSPPWAFGEADPFGLVGESPAMWRLRTQIAFHASFDSPLLITGASGTGKELVAAAVHRLSRQASGPYVTCNVASVPAGLIEAELFGHAKNFPNPGTAEREGIVGAAKNGTLFLDEIGEIPAGLQASLLRLFDQGQEYRRLGETLVRKAQARFVAATNRSVTDLKHDLAGRFVLQISVPDFKARREDVPLLMNHLLRTLARGKPALGRFFSQDGFPVLDETTVDELTRRSYTTNMRELERLLLECLQTSPVGVVTLPQAPRAPTREHAPPSQKPARKLSVTEVTQSLEKHEGVLSRAAIDLGVTRFALRRFIEKYGIRGGR